MWQKCPYLENKCAFHITSHTPRSTDNIKCDDGNGDGGMGHGGREANSL